MPIAWKITAAMPQIKRPERAVDRPAEPDGRLVVVKAGGAGRVSLAMAVRFHLGEVGGVGPGHHRQESVGQRHRGRRRPPRPPAERCRPRIISEGQRRTGRRSR